MRKARIKLDGTTAVYHCISRVVGGQLLLDDGCLLPPNQMVTILEIERGAAKADGTQPAMIGSHQTAHLPSHQATLVQRVFPKYQLIPQLEVVVGGGLQHVESPDFELGSSPFNYWLGRVTVYHATWKRDPKVRFTTYWEPLTKQWIGWTQGR